MHDLARVMIEQIAGKLRRKSITTCSRWTCAYRVMGGKDYPGPWSFKHHPWLLEMHDSEHEFNVGQKSAQMGYTETVLDRTFYKIDVERVDCLYVLPAKTPDASNFSAARFDAALELSDHLSSMFSDVKNIGHKRAGTTNLYIRGSKSRSGLKSVPVGFLVLDEVEEMEEKNIPLALERLSGQLTKQIWAISTPTIDGRGINKMFNESTQDHFYFPCPHCNKQTELIFPECLVITGQELGDPELNNSHLICKECKGKLEHKLKHEWLKNGHWVPSFADKDKRGFYINQLYSPTESPAKIANHYIQAQYNPSFEQEFYNSKLGLPHTVDGARITDSQIEAAKGDYKNKARKKGPIITMGVDIGKWLHCEITRWYPPEHITTDLNIQTRGEVIEISKCLHFEELDILMQEYGINFCVVDNQPETRKAYEFAMRFYGLVRLCSYVRGINGKQIVINQDGSQKPIVQVDRTSWLDMSLGRFKNESIKIPLDTPEEYKMHLKALVRVYEFDRDGNPVGRYVGKSNEADHYAHARNYCEIALPLALNYSVSGDIPANEI